MRSSFITLILIAGILLSSCETQREILTADKRKDEESKVVTTINNFNKANQEKNWYALVETLADEVVFFGTDSAEVITSFADYKKAIEKQWQDYEKLNYGELQDISIQMDNEATFATIIYGQNVELGKGNASNNYYMRGARILKKEKNRWVIVSGIVGIVRSAYELQNEFLIKTDSTVIVK